MASSTRLMLHIRNINIYFRGSETYPLPLSSCILYGVGDASTSNG